MTAMDLKFELTLDRVKNDVSATLEIENELRRRQSTKNLELELTADYVKNNDSIRLEIENELLRRSQAELEEKLKKEKSSSGMRILKGLGLVAILAVYVMYKVGGGLVELSKNEKEAEKFVSHYVGALDSKNVNIVIREFHPLIEDDGIKESIRGFIALYRSEFGQDSEIVESTLTASTAHATEGEPDFVHEYQILIKTSRSLVSMKIIVIHDEVFSIQTAEIELAKKIDEPVGT